VQDNAYCAAQLTPKFLLCPAIATSLLWRKGAIPNSCNNPNPVTTLLCYPTATTTGPQKFIIAHRRDATFITSPPYDYAAEGGILKILY
jgi:hypothetical protein